jgi:hypothetical protein
MARSVNDLENIIAVAQAHGEPLPEPKVLVA